MKRFAGWAVWAGLISVASPANAQMLAPYEPGRSHYQAASDFDQPYAEPPYGAPPAYGGPPVYGAPPVHGAPPVVTPPPPYAYEPAVLPPQEVYAVLHENGFLPLGVPRLHGWVYTIVAMDRAGENGRLLIDARSGRIIRFMPAYWPGERFEEGLSGSFGPEGALPPPTMIRGVPRPPLPIPAAEDRSVPLPTPKPAMAGSPPAQASVMVGEAKPRPPAAQILPTQEMPKVQTLE